MRWLVLIATQLTYPLTLALGLWLLAGGLRLFKRRRLALASMILAFLVLVTPSMPFVSSYLVRSLEQVHPAKPIEQIPEAGAIVVLGGGIEEAHPPRQAPDLNSAADRVAHAARLYHAKKAPRIVVSGSAATVSLLAEWGVPERDILLEDRSRSTRENAVYTHQLLKREGIDRVLLVTSAMHMPRAFAAFRAVGVDAVAVPTDFRITRKPPDRERSWVLSLLPSAGALNSSTLALHEYLGRLYYTLRGWT